MATVTPSRTATTSPTPPASATPSRTFTPTSTRTTTLTPSRTSTPTATATATSTAPVSFPATSLLDNFNRANGALGSNWSGATGKYSLVSNQLQVSAGDNDIYWHASSFGADQEAYVTLITINPSASEIDLLLKAQNSSTVYSGTIEVLYSPTSKFLQVWTYTGSLGWVQRGADIAVTLANGDQLGARATAAGQVLVYRNGALLGTRDVSAWTYSASTGYIGLWVSNGANTVFDNFGGGTVGP